MKTFIPRWAAALSAVAAATVLTAGAVRASDPHTESQSTVDASAVVDLSNDHASPIVGAGCPMPADDTDDGATTPVNGAPVDVGSGAPADVGVGVGVDVGVDVGGQPTTGSGPTIDIGGDVGSQPGNPGTGTGTPGTADPGTADPGTGTPGTPGTPGTGTPGTQPPADLGRRQLLDVDAALGSLGLAVDVPAGNDQLIGLDLDDPPARNDNTDALITLDVDASELSVVDLAGIADLGGHDSTPSHSPDLGVVDPPVVPVTPVPSVDDHIGDGTAGGLLDVHDAANGGLVNGGLIDVGDIADGGVHTGDIASGNSVVVDPIQSAAPLIVAPLSVLDGTMLG